MVAIHFPFLMARHLVWASPGSQSRSVLFPAMLCRKPLGHTRCDLRPEARCKAIRTNSPALSTSSTEFHTQYYAFTGVSSCWDVIHLHRLLWASVVLNVLGLFLGIITAAMLGAYKDMVSRRASLLWRPEKGKEKKKERRFNRSPSPERNI